MCAHAHGLLKGPGSSRVFDALSCYLNLILKHSDTKRGWGSVVIESDSSHIPGHYQ